jgi:hypothetical protein
MYPQEDNPESKKEYIIHMLRYLNKLPQSISKFHNNVHIFKTRLRNVLVTNGFYSIDECICTKHE